MGRVIEMRVIGWLLTGLVLSVVGWYALGFHIVWKPTPAQLFGCEHTYINARGEDTGECG